MYATSDWVIRDMEVYYFSLGRTYDVINVAVHRLGTREIEEAVNMHPAIAECAVVGVADPLKGQMPLAFAVAKTAIGDEKRLEKEIMETVDKQRGANALPKSGLLATLRPQTRTAHAL